MMKFFTVLSRQPFAACMLMCISSLLLLTPLSVTGVSRLGRDFFVTKDGLN